MERFVIIVNGFQPLTIITKSPILDVAAALDSPLRTTDGIGVSLYVHLKIYDQKVAQSKTVDSFQVMKLKILFSLGSRTLKVLLCKLKKHW